MVHGARRESLGGWNEISYSWGIRSRFGSISNVTRKRNSARKLEAAESPVRDARDATGRTQSHFRRHTSGRRSNVMPRLYVTVPLGSYIWISLERLQPVGATSAPPSCTGAQLPPHMVESYTNMREQPMRPAKHPSTVLCLCPTRPCAQSASPAPSRRSVLLGLASRLGISTRSLGVDEHAFVFDELIELDLHGHTPVAQSDAIRRNQAQSGAIRRNPTQSDAIRRNPSHAPLDGPLRAHGPLIHALDESEELRLGVVCRRDRHWGELRTVGIHLFIN